MKIDLNYIWDMKAVAMACKYTLLFFIGLLFAQGVFAQKEGYIQSLDHKNHWVDSVLKKMNRRQKVAQLFFVRASASRGPVYADSIADVIKRQQIGGLVFFQGGPVGQVNLINRYQKLVPIPLLIAMDGEWGLGMRLDSTLSYPFQMTLGAIQDNSLIYRMGQQVADDFKRMGMHMNLAPDIDINNNPDNPVINYRSFGDNKYNVAAKGIAYLKGMQDSGLLTTVKHFPGHGDTNIDSHFDLPLLPFSRKRLDTLEEYPFRQAIQAGVSGVMVAHMDIPALDKTENLPSTLSGPIVSGILKDSLKFKGLVVSDAMEMKAVTRFFPDGQADLKAFLAGNDIIELSENSALAMKKIRKAIRRGQISKQEFEAKVKKVIAAKYWAGLAHYRQIPTTSLIQDLNRPAAKALLGQLSDAATTLLKGNAAALQLNPLKKTALVSVGVSRYTVFQTQLAQWYPVNSSFVVGKSAPENELKTLLETLQGFDQVFLSINDTRARPASKLDFSGGVKLFIAELARHNNTVIGVFANAYAIADLPGIEKCGALLVCYQMTDELQRSAVKAITGQLKPTGRLPVGVNALFTTGSLISLQ